MMFRKIDRVAFSKWLKGKYLNEGVLLLYYVWPVEIGVLEFEIISLTFISDSEGFICMRLKKNFRLFFITLYNNKLRSTVVLIGVATGPRAHFTKTP